jgi:hypothetical protein
VQEINLSQMGLSSGSLPSGNILQHLPSLEAIDLSSNECVKLRKLPKA